MPNFNYTDPRTGKAQTFSYRVPTTKSQNIPVGGFPIKKMVKKAKKK